VGNPADISQAAFDEIRNKYLREMRVSMQLAVRVWGMDVNNKPFTTMAETIEISPLGARLKGVNPVKSGEVIGIQYEDQKARFRVVWLGDPATNSAGEIGVHSLDESKCIWSTALQNQPSIKEQAAAAMPGAEHNALTQNRRRYARYPCSADLELRSGNALVTSRLRITDISLGGCYAETLSPLPVDTLLTITLRSPSGPIHLKGVVCTSHQSMGMGIGFTDVDPEEWKLLVNYVAQLSGKPLDPPPPPDPIGQPAPPAVRRDVEVLLRLLEKKGLLTREEFLNALINGPD